MKEDNLDRIAPKLSSIEKKDVFLCPEDTFDSLPYSVQMAVSAKPRLSLTEKIFRAASIGMTSAIIAGILVITLFSIVSPKSDSFYTETNDSAVTYLQGFQFISGYLAIE